MTTLHHAQSTNTIQQILALLNEFPANYDTEFDYSHEELERQFAELRLTFDHN